MGNETSDIGHVRERELFEALVRRFGRDCVYLNSKYVKPDGLEKELWDVLVLALPYAIVFQMKWQEKPATVFHGDCGAIEIGRLERRLDAAAKQFRLFQKLRKEHKSVLLPRVWREGCGDYELPLDAIEHVIPVVVADFDDPDYETPNKRTCLWPRVRTIPMCLSTHRTIHAFLFKDLVRIIDELFTVGDFATYLGKRQELLESKTDIVRYSELDVFALYLTSYPRWAKLMDEDAVLIEPGVYEAKAEKHMRLFKARHDMFCSADLVDGIIRGVASNDTDDNTCLRSLGRLHLLTALMKKDVSDVISDNLQKCSRINSQDGLSMNSSIGSYASELSPQTYYGIMVVNCEAPYFEVVKEYCYARALHRIKELGKVLEAREVLLLVISSLSPTFEVEVREINRADYEMYNQLMAENGLESVVRTRSWRNVKGSEWDYLKAHNKDFA